MFFASLILATPGHGIDLAAMDRSVKVESPADLFRFANGRWLDEVKIPADKSGVGSFDEIYERNLAIERRIAETQARARQPLTTVGGKVGLMYRLAMDEARANRLGVSPLRDELARIDAVRDPKSLLEAIGHLATIGVGVGFAGGANLDDKDTAHMVYALGQPTLLLYDRELYLKNDARAGAVRAQYLKSEARFLGMAGLDEGGAKDALALETALAKVSSTPLQLRDLESNYHKISTRALRAMTPHTPWDAYFAGVGAQPTMVNVGQPKALQGFDALVASRPVAQWRGLLRAALLTAYAPRLSDAYVNEGFAVMRALTGQQKLEPRWKRAVGAVDATVGEAMGQLYVREAFSPEAKAKVRTMVHNVLAVLHDRIGELDWMGDATKKRALAKLGTFSVKVGYPDKWRDYSALRLKDDSYAMNALRAATFEWRRNVAKLGKPVDRSEWMMTPPTVNAYYNPNWNEIVFPAGILQPGFFDPNADDASNYGAIAAVIGHEITHGFDDQGAQYDPTGLRKDWWTKADKTRFDAKGKAIVAQYNGYRSPSGLAVNGALTEGENIADIGGITVAYLAYRKSLNGVEPPEIDGLTSDQRFFVAWAQNWRSKMRLETERMRISLDSHSPDSVRAMGPAADLPAFYRAFGLPVPESLPHVW